MNIRQIDTAVIGGIQVDVNEALTADYGQWQPGRLPDIVEADMPLTAADADLVADHVLNRLLGETDLAGQPTGTKLSLGQAVARVRAAHSDLKNALATPIDAKALAASIITAVAPLIQQAVASGVQLDDDHLAAVLEQHLSATLANPK